MKKLLVAMIFTMMMSNMGNAEDCINGTPLTAPLNGSTHEYCYSGIDLNWWSAQAWCEANGRTLASIYDICPNWNGSSGSARACGYTDSSFGTIFFWTSTAVGTSEAVMVVLNDGWTKFESRGTPHVAFCR